MKSILRFFDKLEDRMRGRLSHFPLFYAFIAGVGVVLFWRGVWHTTDFITAYALGQASFSLVELVDGLLSFVVGTMILLVTGVYVSAFIGNRLIITGLSGEKKLAEKTKDEIVTEGDEIKKLQKSIENIENEITKIEKDIEQHHPTSKN